MAAVASLLAPGRRDPSDEGPDPLTGLSRGLGLALGSRLLRFRPLPLLDRLAMTAGEFPEEEGPAGAYGEPV